MPFEAHRPADTADTPGDRASTLKISTPPAVLSIAMPGELADALATVLTIAKRHIEHARKIRAVQLAWLDAGPNPKIHQDAKAALFRTWPALATAVADLAGEPAAGGQR